ncbi:putative mitochondrial chaperone bcs1 [Morus notabilis]|uniref:Putative mitochondrial chaperone bcs1 n=1 Tax=Morus notabilis TaxID=981085 RepID=W9QNT8_9ROSA|nr:putative mitochondrial chaperone bcs1 [Morus notabilis]
MVRLTGKSDSGQSLELRRLRNVLSRARNAVRKVISGLRSGPKKADDLSASAYKGDPPDEGSSAIKGAKPHTGRSSADSAKQDRFYNLTFHKRHREMIMEKYTKHVVKEGMEIRRRNRQRKLYSNCAGSSWLGRWTSIVFESLATFETLAMDSEKKNEIMEDSLAFSRNKDFYANAGKAWKRGYLLYRPPGTGKSTMVAAMANLLDYDVYDLELTAVKDNTELRRLLIETTSQRKKKAEKSSREDENDESGEGVKESRDKEGNSNSKVTLSGLLNFIDGLWSSSGSERLIVFTTNHVEKLDPALIRRGRMDNFQGFKVFAKSYLNLETHPLFERIDILMRETNITPADVAENLMPKSPLDDAERRLSNLIQALEEAKEAATAAKKQDEESIGVQPAMEEAVKK